MCWQISVTIMSFGDQEGGERNGSETCVVYFMTHNDLCTYIALTKWDGPVACVNVTEKVEKFQSKFYHLTATQTSVTVSVKQHEHGRVTRCTFSVDSINKDDIAIVAQHVRGLFTTAARRPSQRRDWNASAIWNHEFSNTNLDIFYPKMYAIPDRHLRNDA